MTMTEQLLARHAGRKTVAPGDNIWVDVDILMTHDVYGAVTIGIFRKQFVPTAKVWDPEKMDWECEGPLPPYLMAKDLILHIIGDIGVDGATCRAMEFAGDGVMSLSIEERMTLCNMVIEAGGKNGVIPVDAVTEQFVKSKTAKPYEPVTDNRDARFHSVRRYKSATIEPTVAKPHSPDNPATARAR